MENHIICSLSSVYYKDEMAHSFTANIGGATYWDHCVMSIDLGPDFDPISYFLEGTIEQFAAINGHQKIDRVTLYREFPLTKLDNQYYDIEVKSIIKSLPNTIVTFIHISRDFDPCVCLLSDQRFHLRIGPTIVQFQLLHCGDNQDLEYHRTTAIKFSPFQNKKSPDCTLMALSLLNLI